MDNRGQTLQDFALGVSLFLVTVTFVFGYVPTVFAQYDAPTDSVDQQQANRVAEYIVENYSVAGQANVLRNGTGAVTGVHATLSTDAGFERLREVTGLNTTTDERARPNLNVRLVNTTEVTGEDEKEPIRVGGRGPYEFGESWRPDTPAATETRVVRLGNDTGQCEPTCWLVVRVW